MRQFAALLGLVFALLNVYAAYLLAWSGIRQVSKEILDRGLLFMGGLTVGIFALILVGQCLQLLVSRE
ncbi:MAG TPA: hypothetical protein VGD99_05465 [Anaerolineae bacterium]|jgi:hypothetical protein